ncbi:MAG: alpha/beta hydrolase [Alistipes sp.]|nr:alpha/beta hydrolase [Alistipes sp.]
MRRLMSWVVGIVVVLVAAAIAGGCYLTAFALRPEVDRTEQCYIDSFNEHYPTLQSWFEALRHEGKIGEVTITAPDGTTLHAYHIAADTASQRTAVLVHGYTDHPFGMMQYGWIYREKLGCNLLLPTLRYHGKSGGDHIQMGWRDRLDVKQWLVQADSLFGVGQQIVVHGLSMGGATVMMLSGEEDLPASVRCMVEDCGYMGVWEQFQKELKEDYHLPSFPVLHIANLVCRMRYGWDFLEASALEAVKRSTLPMLFIHGGDDHYVPTWMVHPLYAVKEQGDKRKWLSPEAGHADAFMDHPEEYTRQVVEFCEAYF